VLDAAARRHQRRLVAIDHRDVVLAEAAGREPGAPGQPIGGDDHHLAPVEGGIEVEAVEGAVGDRRADRDAVVDAGQRQIVEVAGGAGDLGDAVDARQRAADRTGGGRHWRQGIGAGTGATRPQGPWRTDAGHRPAYSGAMRRRPAAAGAPALGLGTRGHRATLRDTDVGAAERAVAAAIDHGCALVVCAPGWGESERIVGAAVRALRARDRVVVATASTAAAAGRRR
jgi:hypothetical protein